MVLWCRHCDDFTIMHNAGRHARYWYAGRVWTGRRPKNSNTISWLAYKGIQDLTTAELGFDRFRRDR